MTGGRLQFDIQFDKPRRASRRSEDAPFRLLVLADLTGRPAGQRGTPLAARKPLRVDVDNFDAVFARLAPHVELVTEGGTLAIDFADRDDFHPDALYRRLAPFAGLRGLRAELQNPALYQRAAAALRGAPAASPAAAPTPGAAPADATDDVARLLGRRPDAPPTAAPAAPQSAAASTVDRFIRDLVAPQVVADTRGEQAALLAALDKATAGAMRGVLHHPAFQALEATWRGLANVVTGTDGDTIELFVVDVSRAELEADLRAAEADLSSSWLYNVLNGPATQPPDGKRWSLLAGDYTFGTAAADLWLLAAIGTLAQHAGAPFLAAAQPALTGCSTVGELATPAAWPALAAEDAANVAALRGFDAAPWIGLALPRVLARLPYGRKTDPVTAFEFEEIEGTAAHEELLWGNPAYALALLALQSFQEDGWSMTLDARLEIEDLPAYVTRVDGESKLTPCAEILLAEAAASAVLARGLMPLMSYGNRNGARLLRWQSIAAPAAPLRGPWDEN